VTMSWSSYIGKITESGVVSDVAIYKHNGTVVASSPGLEIEKSEILDLVAAFEDRKDISRNGFLLEKERYTYVESEGDTIQGQSQSSSNKGGVYCTIGIQIVVVAFYKDESDLEDCKEVVNTYSQYFVDTGF
ncbi:hypothetical protein BGZ49_004541, partial [Haplosporangium sp. Z 27]